MEKEAQNPQTGNPRNGDFGKEVLMRPRRGEYIDLNDTGIMRNSRFTNLDGVLEELMRGPKHLTTPKVSLTEEIYTPSKAMKEVPNITTLIGVIRDKDFLMDRLLSNGTDWRHCFYISSKDIPQEFIDTLERVIAAHRYDPVPFRIDWVNMKIIPVSKREFNMLSPPERGIMSIGVLRAIDRGELLTMHHSFGELWEVSGLPPYADIQYHYRVAIVESTE